MIRSLLFRYGINAIFVSVIGATLILAINPGLFEQLSMPEAASSRSFATFRTILLGIVLETLPFLLLGVAASSFMQLFVPESAIRRFIPRHPLLGIPFACLLGFLFPVCECGLIPVVRRLIAKGMPLYIGIVFILVGPIVNPVVLAATYTAFRGRPELIYSRVGLALLAGVFIGLFVYAFVRRNPLRSGHEAGGHGHVDGHEDDHARGHTHPHHRHDALTLPEGGKFLALMDHAGSEFFDMGKYVMVGSILTAAIQSFLPRAGLAEIGQHELGSHLFMMGFAYILSICSTSDAFVASSFASAFPASALLTFLVFGPMLDFKSTLMLLSVFHKRFVLLLCALIAICVPAGALACGAFYLSSSP